MALSREFVAENSEKTLETPLDKQGSFRDGKLVMCPCATLNLGKEDGCRIHLETFRWNPAGNQARPEELGQQPEASLAWCRGDPACEA
jgi:hypothetical protein